MTKRNKKIINARRINKMRWIAGIAMSAIVILITIVATLLNIIDFYSEDIPEAGLHTLRMFTTISNIIAAVAAFMCLPFQIDGLKKDRYRLPSWIVVLLYVGAVGTLLTFFVASTMLSITQGFVTMMFLKSNLFLHTLNPIFINILFILILSDFHIEFRKSFFALIPVASYSTLYLIMVHIAKVWNDHYYTNTYIPWPVFLLILIVVSFAVAQIPRVLHNLTHKYVENSIRRYYLETSDYDFPLVSDAVKKLAKVESKYFYEGDDIYIPVDIIALLSERYKTSLLPVDILYDIYLETYLICIKKSSKS